MREVAIRFGENRNLVGIITEPENKSRRLGLILVTAGLVPKYGPFRLYAELARILAKKGIVVFRFDLSGIGDSQQSPSNAPLKVRTQEDIRAAVNELSRQVDLDGITLCGLCSGAEDSFRYAESDHRITGTILLDPFAYDTSESLRRGQVQKIPKLALKYWRSIRNPRMKELLKSEKLALVDYQYMVPAESKKILSTLIQRNARVHVIYTGGMNHTYRYKNQFQDMFPDLDFSDRVTVEFMPKLGHTQLLQDDRNQVIDSVVQVMS